MTLPDTNTKQQNNELCNCDSVYMLPHCLSVLASEDDLMLDWSGYSQKVPQRAYIIRPSP
jgi:hypothetical protein